MRYSDDLIEEIRMKNVQEWNFPKWNIPKKRKNRQT